MAQFKGDSYVGGSLGVARNIDVGGRIQGSISPSDAPYFISAPKGGGYSSTSSSATGYIRIRLPVRSLGNLVKFKVSVFEYLADGSFDLFVAGCNTSSWTYTQAALIASVSTQVFTVRFGYFTDTDSNTYDAIYIGESTSTWHYVQIRVHDLMVGYNSPSLESYSKNWAVTVTTSLGTVASSKTATPPLAKWG